VKPAVNQRKNAKSEGVECVMGNMGNH
jgi:hypothetical protein